jgi:hypothetical protein
MPDGNGTGTDFNGIFGPMQFSPLWTLLGVLIILVIIAWYVFALVRTRRKPIPYVQDPLADFFEPGERLRATYASLIDDVVRENAKGTLPTRQAHQQLSLIVREFAAQSRGIPAQYMTLEDLRATHVAPLSSTVGELYPGAFSADSTGSVTTAADRARRLVNEWR